MNKKLKLLMSITISAVIGTSLLAGCGSKGGSTENGKVKLELFSTKAENKTILQSLANEFQEKNPNIEISINSPANAGTVLKTRLAKNDMPDLVSLGADVNYGALVDANALVDLTNDGILENIQKPYLDMLHGIASNDNGKIYGVPYATNADGVLYNKDIFSKLGLQIPKTWDEFMAVSKKIKDAGQLPLYLTLKDAWTGMCFWNVIASDLEPSNFLADKKAGKTTFEATHGEIVDKMETIGTLGQEDILGVSYNDGNAAFAQGKSAMYLQGNWAISEIKKANPNINIGMFPLPASNDPSKNNIISGIDVFFGITSKSKHSDEAKKFIEFMTQKENAQKYIKDQFAFSAVKDVTQDDQSVTDVQESFKNGKIGVFPDHYYPSSFDAASLVQGFYSKKDKAEFLKQLDTEYDKANSKQ
ncbi:ABC transporter substrate-binding protein [Clostridium sp. 2-1]|uniref:ABC transporter substrate-binding protein n=1 Tax=Clostridium TaxID=1485 RepID=UPI000CDA3C54|nr:MULTISPECIES: extracellular solute-binding protein [Clostridium]MBN7575550.1 extracellular solute-binding protein [Clostridium beijerinckii]MBN7580861.1 extracellular solute-binding protein [Clostridium beijerinckii]MBN7585314.1 extracellular solute-binding protein [Clostridium beijerinckii]MBO0521114.1 extracellular solute-binding protein [Clostridium beijerinckii]POO91529.1 ABC transporter substrate-binding protein [Clostridium sp. 2-1]